MDFLILEEAMTKDQWLHSAQSWGLGLVLVGALMLAASPAEAIPVAGDYLFTSGLTGTFTSTGSSLSAWEIQFGPAAWSNLSSIIVFQNNADIFENDSFLTFDSLHLDWRVNRYIIPTRGLAEGSFSFSPVSSVPEPGTGLLVVTGILGFVGYHQWRLRKQNGLQAG